MPISKKVDFIHTFSIITIVSLGSILLFTNSSSMFLPIIARSHALNNAHQEQQPIPQTPLRITTSNQESIPNVPTNNNKVVIITFGDGYQSQYTYAKPILDKYGYKGNYFVTCNRVGTPTKMTWTELGQLYKEDNVIGSKTVD